MIVRGIAGTILGATVSVMWLTLSWMILPWHETALQTFEDADTVGEVLRENVPAHGVYVAPRPGPEENLSHEEMSERIQNGPFVFAVVRPGEKEGYLARRALLRGIVIQLVGAALMAIILTSLSPALTYLSRVTVATVTGLFAGVVGHLPAWNWWEFPAGYVVLEILDLTMAWMLAGFVMVLVVVPGSGYMRRGAIPRPARI